MKRTSSKNGLEEGDNNESKDRNICRIGSFMCIHDRFGCHVLGNIAMNKKDSEKKMKKMKNKPSIHEVLDEVEQDLDEWRESQEWWD